MSGEFLFVLRNHMMRFTAFPEIQLNPGMRNISLYPLFPRQGTRVLRDSPESRLSRPVGQSGRDNKKVCPAGLYPRLTKYLKVEEYIREIVQRKRASLPVS